MDSAITIYIIGHGEENIQVPFNNNDESLKLLSFVGSPGKLGELFKCPAYNNQPIDKVVNFFIHKLLLDQYAGKVSLNNEEQNDFFNSVGTFLENVYEECGYPVEDGFSITYPLSERYFYLEPNPHENCRLCSDPEEYAFRKKYDNKITCCPARCLEERNPNKLDCPEYGLLIVCSSFPQDERFTLAGGNFKERYNANINMSLSNKTYWKGRASQQYKYLIDQICDLKYITMTDLNNLFKSMGFKNVYIFDPTCRKCEIEAEKVEDYKRLERTKPSERVIVTQPTDYIPKNTSLNTGNSFVNDCVNGVCKIFQKSKVDGGTRKYRKKWRKTKKRHLKRKTRKYLKKVIKHRNYLKKERK
jgi:hypothetical protein